MHKMTAAQAEQRLADLAEQFAQWRQQRNVPLCPVSPPAVGAGDRFNGRLTAGRCGEGLAAAGA